MRGSCGLWWPLVGVWAGRSPASVGLLVGCFCGVCWSPGCSPGCKVRGVMDRGGLDGLSFERGGRSADYVPASASFCWSLSASASVLVGSSLGLRGGRADSLLCFEVATLRARRAGLRLLASLRIGCAVRIGDSFKLASMCWAGIRCAVVCSRAPAAGLSCLRLLSFAWLLSCIRLPVLVCLSSSPRLLAPRLLASSARRGWLARLALALPYSRLLGGGNSLRLSD